MNFPHDHPKIDDEFIEREMRAVERQVREDAMQDNEKLIKFCVLLGLLILVHWLSGL
jgi:hypothetical protein